VSRLEDLFADGDAEALAEELGPDTDPDDGFLIIYTSGTTARPKGCFHTVNTLRATAYAMAASLAYDEHDVQFGPSPISHATGIMTSFLLPLVAGASSHLMEAWEPVEGMRRHPAARLHRLGDRHGLPADDDGCVRRVGERPGQHAHLGVRRLPDPRLGRREGRSDAVRRPGAQPLRALGELPDHDVHGRRPAGALDDL
jgi:hypothetical protein